MKKFPLLLSSMALLCVCHVANAQTADVSIVNTVTNSILSASGSLLPLALTWLSSFMLLQFLINNIGLLKSGADIEAVIGKFMGSMLWFGFCFYIIINGPDFISGVGHGILEKFAPNLPGPGTILKATLGLSTALIAGIFAIGIVHTAIGILLVQVLFIVGGTGLYLAIKVMMLSLELGLVVMLSPLSFSLLGLNALRDQGIAPLKSLLSLVYRIILLGIVYSSFAEVVKVSGVSLAAIPWKNPLNWPDAINVIVSMLAAYPVIGYLVFKSDSIAASLAGGQTGQGAGDVASAAAAGAAAGAALSSGGASATGAATKVSQGMGDVIKAMMGSGGGSVSNASSRGMGGQATGEAPRRQASMSMPNSNSGTGGAPQRPNDASPGNPAQRPSRSASTANVDTAPSRAAMNNVAATQSPDNTGSGSAEQGSNASAAGNVAPGENGSLGASTTTQGDRASSSVDAAPVRPATPAATGTPPGQPQETQAGSKNVDPAPVRPAQTANSRPPVRPVESGATAGIGGASSPMEKKVDQVLAALDQQQQPKKATFREKLGDANHHIAQEKAVTQVSINTHHSD